MRCRECVLLLKLVDRLQAKLVTEAVAKALIQLVFEVLPSEVVPKCATATLLLGHHPACLVQ